uniref:Midnolin n=1 Tax=Hucho hucho TaxID=62062 RepID=A0A4W5KRF3_9TELE
MPKLGKRVGKTQALSQSFKVLATIIGYRMDQHPSARSCTSRGAPSCEAVPSEPSMNLYIHSTTGTRFELALPLEETVEGLKRRLSQRLKVPKERLALLHKETRLSSGKLQDLGISDGSKLTLVPTVEAGLMSQASRPEQSVMQALESLTETQVSDFLSGRSPLTLALRVGDHMMFVQLQLAAQQSGGQHLQHRQLIARGSAEGTMGQSTGASGGFNSGHHPRAPTPHHHHSHPHSRPHPNQSQAHPVPFPSTSTAAFPPAPSHQPSPPMYPSSSSTPSSHCSTPPPAPRPSLPGSLFSRSHQPSPGRPSPSPASDPQSTPTAAPCPEANCAKSPSNGTSASVHSSSSSSRKPGAIIESFVNHAPGVFSGTFSGTLHPNCQDSTGRPRRDIGTILQILNDLLSATRHYQGVPPSLTQLRYQTQCGSPSPTSTPPSPPPSPPATTAGIAGISAKATSVPARNPISPPLHPLVQCQNQIRMCKPPGDRVRQTENRATRCKVERLQLLMQQKRLRRKARRDSRAPYHWLPNRKAGRSNSNSSVSSEGSMDLDFDDSVWKPDVKADMKSEFVMA